MAWMYHITEPLIVSVSIILSAVQSFSATKNLFIKKFSKEADSPIGISFCKTLTAFAAFVFICLRTFSTETSSLSFQQSKSFILRSWKRNISTIISDESNRGVMQLHFLGDCGLWTESHVYYVSTEKARIHFWLCKRRESWSLNHDARATFFEGKVFCAPHNFNDQLSQIHVECRLCWDVCDPLWSTFRRPVVRVRPCFCHIDVVADDNKVAGSIFFSKTTTSRSC